MLRSVILEIPIKVECAVIGTNGENQIIRVRMGDGRWLRVETFEHRLLALGARLEKQDNRTVSAGTHVPIF